MLYFTMRTDYTLSISKANELSPYVSVVLNKLAVFSDNGLQCNRAASYIHLCNDAGRG